MWALTNVMSICCFYLRWWQPFKVTVEYILYGYRVHWFGKTFLINNLAIVNGDPALWRRVTFVKFFLWSYKCIQLVKLYSASKKWVNIFLYSTNYAESLILITYTFIFSKTTYILHTHLNNEWVQGLDRIKWSLPTYKHDYIVKVYLE